MEELVRFLKESCHLNGKKTQHALDLMRTLNSVKASQELSNFFMLCNSKAEEEVAHSLALKALEIYENSGKRTLGPQRLYLSISSVEEALASGYASLHISQGPVQTSSDFSKQLARYIRHGTSSQSSNNSVYYQDWGNLALASPVDNDAFPVQADATVTERLWPLQSWNEDLRKRKKVDGNLSAEDALKHQINKQNDLPEYVNSVFIKATGALCAPKVPDFYLVKKFTQVATPETVGAILFTQSTSQSRNYGAVGEAIAVGQKFLSNASKQRRFIIVGVTNLTAIKWFKVYRSDEYGDAAHYCRRAETANVRESLAGFMCCCWEDIGLTSGFVMVGGTSHPLGRWLGEGHTSHVYIVHVNDEEFAVKVPKSGKNVATDIKYLEKLHGIKGIPVINSTYSTPYAMFTQPVCFKCTKEVFYKENLPVCLGKLVDILKSAHDRLVVNRDVRLENVMIANREPIIVDWGFAAPLSEAVCYSGTTYFASERVLRLLEEGNEVFPCEASDDLASLVQSLSLFSRFNLSKQMDLYGLDKHDYTEIRRFWEKNLGSQAKNLLELALNRSYSELKERIQIWADEW